ncbi:putative pre-mRNA-splicing factor ATP-dependent RNA helicase mog-1 [Diplonema papillatum]|nr:putative pre-mRNA-splicing factor ATP-dependent RNA helicase mog-1 [Diplonema papillatum]KAJ9464911.1 putative pre-mRNA-splicing factor ATP-dependent RNA helicase mog-1 [Diplonema papillatum]WGM50044.1 PRP16 [Diplonema papillatum]|eukprot:gene14758-22583_t
MSQYGLDALAKRKREERAQKEGGDRSMAPPGMRPSAHALASEFLKKRKLSTPVRKERGDRPGSRRDGDGGSSGGNGRAYTPSPERDDNARRHKGYSAGEWVDKDEARMWYEGGDEFGGSADASELEGHSLESAYSKKRLEEREENMRKSMAGKVTVRTLRAEQRNAESKRWEESRMMSAGAMSAAEIERDDDVLDAAMVKLIVTKPSPAFLAGGASFSTRRELVLPVRDAGGELYDNAKKGSAILRFAREQRERQKADRDALDNTGTMVGNLVSGTGDTAAEYREERRRVLRERMKMSAEELQEEEKREAQQSASFNVKSDAGAATVEFRAKIKAQRESLPVYGSRDQFLRLIRENNVVVLVGETGSGKTTQIAQYLYEDGYAKPATEHAPRRVIACTQPRRVAAMSVAKRVSEEVGTELGDKVGYSIRFEDCTSENTLIKYMTDGVLLRETMRDPDVHHYSAVIMDEAHERSLNTDVLFGIMKTCVGRRRDLKLIVTSATMDADKFSSFFCNCPIFKIPGRTFPVEIFYQGANVADYVDRAVKQACEIHMTAGKGDILIFMTGQEEIEVAAQWITSKLEEADPVYAETIMVLPIYSLLPSETQAKIFDTAPPGVRKCIIATNIAETSLTVDGIFYVIDTGFCKLKLFNPKTGMDALQVFPESQAAAKQRAGRAGRTGPGRCFRLFTEYQFHNEMLAMTVPEIQRTSLASVILLLKSLGVKNLLHFEFMDPPPQENMANAMYQLWMLGALSDEGELTATGHDMNEFPVDPAMAKCLLYSCSKEDCAEEMLTVISCMSSQSKIFSRPRQQEEVADQMREKFVVAESDHLTLLNAYQMFKMNGRSQRWCNDHFLNFKAIKRVEEVRVQLREIMQKKRKRVNSCGHDWDPVKKCLVAGYFPHCGQRRGVQEYYTMLTGVPCCVHPSSALFNGGTMPDYVVYHELIFTQKEYMSTVSAVDGIWLEEIAPTFFEVRRDRFAKAKKKAEDEAKRRHDERGARGAGSDEEDLSAMSSERAIEAVLGKQKKPKQAIAEIGGKPTPGTAAFASRRLTPARTPGTPGFRRRGI